eukprot:5482427-Amphidinium_carterae.1
MIEISRGTGRAFAPTGTEAAGKQGHTDPLHQAQQAPLHRRAGAGRQGHECWESPFPFNWHAWQPLLTPLCRWWCRIRWPLDRGSLGCYRNLLFVCG